MHRTEKSFLSITLIFVLSSPRSKMPGIIIPASSTASKVIRVIQHDTAEDLLSAAGVTLQHHERSSNIILGHALQKAMSESTPVDHEKTSYSRAYLTSPLSAPPRSDSFWLTVWSSKSSSTSATLDLVLSCISSTLGNYPIFLWTPHCHSTMPLTWLVPRIAELTQHLYASTPPKRIFSVFGKTLLVKAFSQYWSGLTGFLLEPEPFYAAYHTFCTPESLKESNHQIPTNHRVRRAIEHDLDCVAQLCQEFADSSVSNFCYVFALSGSN